MALNVELLDKTMAHIEAHLDAWNQASWAQYEGDDLDTDELAQILMDDPNNPPCGTGMCFAGWACVLSGHKLHFRTLDWAPYGAEAVMCNTDHGLDDIPETAQELLGITFAERNELFDGGNTLEDLQALVDELKTTHNAQEGT